ncbi:peptide ABC transporter substrate-binding protein [Lactobacillus agrestimuris]|uniref:peptide ABC transporter substrate-binding protein n=1 Tax=Lactobacillus agrestimuris TaxID=2941328 RepID=UPI0020444CB5|nr:peptide ABC transporter substrate-binding protein [Lactobacillus agrestimuris]
MEFKRVLLSASVVLAGLSLTACGKKSSTAGKTDQTLHLMQTGEILSLDNSNEANISQWNVLENTMEGLYRADKKGNPTPAMATSVAKATNNGKSYTFNLRKDAKWSNGDPVTAEDFVASWRRSVSPKSKSGYSYIFTGVKNATKVAAGKLPTKDLGVKAVNKHTLQVDLEYPMPYFDRMMVLPAFFPQSQTALKKFGDSYGTDSNKMYYNGPFKVDGWTGSNLSWDLDQNKYYYDKKDIHLKKMKMQVVKDANTAHQLFQQGNLDDATITGTTAQGMQKDKDLMHLKRAGVYYLQLNQAKGHPFSNVKLRQALNLVLDRNHLAEKVLADGSTPAYTFVAPTLAVDPTTGKDFAKEMKPAETYNLKKAKKLWVEGLKELNKKSVTLSYYTDDQTINRNTAQFVQSQVETKLPGANVEVHSVPAKNAMDNVNKGNFDMHFSLWLADFADPMSDLDVLQTGNSLNNGKYSSNQYDKVVKSARSARAVNTASYWSDVRNAQRQLTKDAGTAPLYNMTESHLVRNNLKGVLWHSVGEVDYTRAFFK